MKLKKILSIVILVLLLGIGAWWLMRIPQNTVPRGKVSSESSNASVGEIIAVPVHIDSKSAIINAAEIYLSFDPAELQVESIDTTGSFFTIWITDSPRFSNADGTIALAGGLPTPGHTGEGLVATVKAKVLKRGSVTLEFTDKSRVLLNDGLGTTQPMTMPPIRITGR